MKVKSLSHVRLFATPWTVAYHVPLTMGFSRQEYWSGLPFPSPDLPDPGIKPGSPGISRVAGNQEARKIRGKRGVSRKGVKIREPSEPPGKSVLRD